jgi:ParB/RepB/Spo0J family partition protein
MAITAASSAQSVRLDRISIPDNVRDLDDGHVQALAGSIALQGMLVPVVVRATGQDRFELVAGFHRVAAAQSLELAEVPAVIRDAKTEDADRAVENITRKQLNPYEEARAVGAMLARGLTEDGAAQALGWSRSRVTARMRILDLPERAQQLVGAGVIALSAIDALRSIGGVAPKLLDALVSYVDANDWAADRLTREPGWVLGEAMRDGEVKAFAAYLNRIDAREAQSLRLGKKADGRLVEAEQLHRQLDRYAYGPPEIRFVDADVDQARAAGVLIEFDHGAPIIVDRSLYRELAKSAIARTVERLRDKAAAAARERRLSASLPRPAPTRWPVRAGSATAGSATSPTRRMAPTSIWARP